MKKLNFTLDREKCIQCDACIADCPRKIIRRTRGYPGVAPEAEDDCIGCQHCLAICPVAALSVFGLDPEKSLPLTGEPPVSPQNLRRLIRGRRTVRQYRQENVDRALIDGLLADIAHAPTGGNTCDLTFTVVADRRRLALLLENLVAGLEKIIETGVEIPEFMRGAVRAFRQSGEDEIFRGAPHLLIALAGEKAYCGDADVVIALSYFELLAQSHGLGTTWCDFLKFILDSRPELAGLFGITTERPFRAILFGHPAIRYARSVQRDDAAMVRII